MEEQFFSALWTPHIGHYNNVVAGITPKIYHMKFDPEYLGLISSMA